MIVGTINQSSSMQMLVAKNSRPVGDHFEMQDDNPSANGNLFRKLTTLLKLLDTRLVASESSQ